jgi:hypothetical protein
VTATATAPGCGSNAAETQAHSWIFGFVFGWSGADEAVSENMLAEGYRRIIRQHRQDTKTTTKGEE